MVCQTIYSINALTLLAAYENSDYADVLGRADLLLADGIGAVWAIQRLTGKQPEHVPGIDLILDLVRVCKEEKQSVFLIGGRPGVAERCARKLRQDFPGLKIAGVQAGYWQFGTEHELIDAINQSQPDLLLVGLGQPAQEYFLDQYRHCLAVRVAMGVGGSFDVISGDLKRAPRWLRRWGMEWLFRMLQQPRRFSRLFQLLYFVWVVLLAFREK